MNFFKAFYTVLFQILMVFIVYKYAVHAGIIRETQANKSKQYFNTGDGILKNKNQIYHVMPKQSKLQLQKTKNQTLTNRSQESVKSEIKSNHDFSKVSSSVSVSTHHIHESSRQLQPKVTVQDFEVHLPFDVSTASHLRSFNKILPKQGAQKNIAKQKKVKRNRKNLLIKLKGQHHKNVRKNQRTKYFEGNDLVLHSLLPVDIGDSLLESDFDAGQGNSIETTESSLPENITGSKTVTRHLSAMKTSVESDIQTEKPVSFESDVTQEETQRRTGNPFPEIINFVSTMPEATTQSQKTTYKPLSEISTTKFPVKSGLKTQNISLSKSDMAKTTESTLESINLNTLESKEEERSQTSTIKTSLEPTLTFTTQNIFTVSDHATEFNINKVKFGNEPKAEIDQKIVEYIEENVTSSNKASYLYINASKIELKIIMPLIENGSFSIDDIKEKLMESGLFRNMSFFQQHIKGDGQISFYGWVKQSFKQHKVEEGFIIGIITMIFLVFLFIYLIRRIRRKPRKYSDIYSGEEHLYELIKSKTSAEESQKKQKSSSSSSSEEFSPSTRKQARKSIQIVDKLMSRGKEQKELDLERRLLSSSSSDDEDSDTKPKELDKEKLIVKKSIEKKKTIETLEDKKGKSRKKGDMESIKIHTDQPGTKRVDDKQRKRKPRKKETPVATDKLERKEAGKKMKKKKLESVKKITETSSDEFQKKGEKYTERKKKRDSPRKKRKPMPSKDSDIEDDYGMMPTFRRLSQWVQRQVYREPSPEASDEQGAGEMGDISQRSSSELDKTYTSKRQRLLTFISPSRRKKVKTFRKKMKKKVAPSVRSVVSESDFLSEITLPPVDPSELKTRIVTTGDCKKIDDMLISDSWSRSFYTAHDIQTIGDREKSLHEHCPIEKRKIDTAKINESQAQILGTLSKGSSTQSLQDVIGKSVRKAEVTASSPIAVKAYNLKTRPRR